MRMIRRRARVILKELGRQFPAVLILGPRQCGKTTLSKEGIKGSYFDLEKPADQRVFLGDPELALSRTAEPVILDEVQCIPQLFPILRSVIDEKRRKNGRFYLLGSVNPSLLQHVSESLAGRVGILELTPFLRSEAKTAGVDLATHWLRGGFPDACMARNSDQWERWQDAYLRTFIERDVSRHGIKTSCFELRRFLTMGAHHHGGLLNASEIGRAFGLTYHTVQRYRDILEGHYLTRRLQPYAANRGKQLVKTPKIYIRDSGLLHHLLGIKVERDLLASPKRGWSWEGYMIEQVIALEQLMRPASRFSFYRTKAGAEIDLIVERGVENIGFEFKSALSATPDAASNLKDCLASKIISKGFVVCLGSRRYPLADNVDVIGAEQLLDSPL